MANTMKVIPIRSGGSVADRQWEIAQLAFDYWLARFGLRYGSPEDDFYRARREVMMRCSRPLDYVDKLMEVNGFVGGGARQKEIPVQVGNAARWLPVEAGEFGQAPLRERRDRQRIGNDNVGGAQKLVGEVAGKPGNPKDATGLALPAWASRVA